MDKVAKVLDCIASLNLGSTPNLNAKVVLHSIKSKLVSTADNPD